MVKTTSAVEKMEPGGNALNNIHKKNFCRKSICLTAAAEGGGGEGGHG